MGRMGDVLAGSNAVWEFDTDAVLIRYERGIRNAKLLQALGGRRVPYEALAGVELGPGKRGSVVLRAVPRRGADPLMEAADGQLRVAADPYRLVLPAEREQVAEYYAEQLHSAITGTPEEPAERYLVDVPAAPQSFKAYDAKASFDGATVSFRWFWTGASSAKWKAGDQHFPVTGLSGVDWRSPEMMGGYLRLLPRDDAGGGNGDRTGSPDDDPTAVVFGLGYGLVHESLPLAAAVLAAVQRATRARPR
jgi:hypothetical protein